MVFALGGLVGSLSTWLILRQPKRRKISINISPSPRKCSNSISTEGIWQQAEHAWELQQHINDQEGPPAGNLALPLPDLKYLGERAHALTAKFLVQYPLNGPIQPEFSEQSKNDIMFRPLPESGVDAQKILDWLSDVLQSNPMGNGHKRFFAWIMSAPSHIGLLANIISEAVNTPDAGVPEHNANVYLHEMTVRWLAELVGFPYGQGTTSQGILCSGGTMANMTALAIARHWKVNSDRADGLKTSPQLVVYASDQVHHCIHNTVELLGIGTKHLRAVPSDDDMRMIPRELERMIIDDRACGLVPLAVVATAGTTNTGAVDPLDAIADICQRENLWFHVDGAYGAFGILDTSKAVMFKGMHRADSLTLDPHKWLSVPLDSGALLVRDGGRSYATFASEAKYLPPPDSPAATKVKAPYWHQFTLTSQGRSARVCATIAFLGIAGCRSMITSHNRLAMSLADLIEEHPRLERLAPTSLSIVVFRYRPKSNHSSDEVLNKLNQQIADEINYGKYGGKFFATTTVLRGIVCQRACITSYGTTYQV